MDEKSVGLISTQDPSSWRVYVDRAANQRGSGVELVLVSPEKITIEKSLRLGFSATNNEAEYEVFVDGNDDGPENGWKNGEGFFRFKANGGPSKR